MQTPKKTYEANKTLEAMVPTPYGESQMIEAAPRIGDEPRPTEDTKLPALEGTDAEPIEGVEEEITFAQGARQRISSISWDCRTNGGNALHYGGGTICSTLPRLFFFEYIVASRNRMAGFHKSLPSLRL